MVLEKLDRYVQKIKLDHRLPAYTRISSKWIKVLNVRLNPIKIIEGNTGSKIWTFLLLIVFSGISSQARETKEKINA